MRFADHPDFRLGQAALYEGLIAADPLLEL
jgi:hypothetical protein